LAVADLTGDLFGALATNGIPVDKAAAERAVIEAVIRVADPGARLVNRSESPVSSAMSGPVEWNRMEYVRILDVGDGLVAPLTEAARAWLTNGVSGVIIDMRGAQGASLAALDAGAGLFLGPNVFMYRSCAVSGENPEVHRTAENGLLAGRMPAVILLDGRTAGSAEAFAAVLKGRRGLLLVGEPTRGGGIIRDTLAFGEETAWIAMRRATLREDGPPEFFDGVEPDVAAEGGDTVLTSAESFRDSPGKDEALSRAADLLLGLRALGNGSGR
jgi:C-terminal processing protease CtpA/Prc